MTTQPEPDSLHQRIAAAIDDGDSHSCMYQEGIDEYELADAVLAVVQPVIDDLATRASQQAELLGIAEHTGNTAEAAREEAARRAEQAEAALARVRDLVADMQGVTGARWWADQLTTALAPPVPADNPDN